MVSGEAAHIPATLTDEEIVGRVLSGDTATFEILVRRYNQRLYRAAYAILRDPDEAEDVLQEAYVRAYEHLAQFEGRASFSTWLTRIAVNEALGRRRSRQQVQSCDAGQEPGEFRMQACKDDGRDPEQATSDTQLRAALETAIGELPDVYRVTFVLRAVEGMNGAETAACLGIGEDTVKTRLHRARSLLRRKLSKRLANVGHEVFPFLGHHCDRVTAAVMARIAALRER